MNTHRATEWFYDDTLWRALTPLMLSKERCGDAAALVPRALKLVRPAGKDVLDLCCRSGRWSISLTQRGFRVTGVGRKECEALLTKATAKAKTVTTPSS